VLEEEAYVKFDLVGRTKANGGKVH